jgi:hypothetical protein
MKKRKKKSSLDAFPPDIFCSSGEEFKKEAL